MTGRELAAAILALSEEEQNLPVLRPDFETLTAEEYLVPAGGIRRVAANDGSFRPWPEGLEVA